MAGIVLGAAAARAAVVLDGLATSVAALLAVHSANQPPQRVWSPANAAGNAATNPPDPPGLRARIRAATARVNY